MASELVESSEMPHLTQRRLHTAVIDPQPELLGSRQLAEFIEVVVKLGVAQRRLERFDLFSVRPTEGLLHLGQGLAHLERQTTGTLIAFNTAGANLRAKLDLLRPRI